MWEKVFARLFALTPQWVRVSLRRLKYYVLGRLPQSTYWNFAASISPTATICTDCVEEERNYFNETLTLRLEGRTIELNYSPGHSRDSISVYVHEDRLMIAGDTVMPVPAIVGGDLDDMVGSLTAMKQKNMENLVQGHGDVLLRGEIEETLDANIHYLRTIDRLVRESIARGVPRSGLGEITIEDCGLSRIPLGGIAVRLHQGNLLSLYDTYRSEMKSRRLA